MFELHISLIPDSLNNRNCQPNIGHNSLNTLVTSSPKHHLNTYACVTCRKKYSDFDELHRHYAAMH